MPQPPKRLPEGVRGLVLRAGEVANWGVSRSRMRQPDVAHPFHGVAGFDFAAEEFEERCRAYDVLLLPGQVFSHLTALALLGAPPPRRFDSEPLHLSVLFPWTPPRGVGIRGHSLTRLVAIDTRRS